MKIWRCTTTHAGQQSCEVSRFQVKRFLSYAIRKVCDRQTDGQPCQKQYVSHFFKMGRHNKLDLSLKMMSIPPRGACHKMRATMEMKIVSCPSTPDNVCMCEVSLKLVEKWRSSSRHKIFVRTYTNTQIHTYIHTQIHKQTH